MGCFIQAPFLFPLIPSESPESAAWDTDRIHGFLLNFSPLQHTGNEVMFFLVLPFRESSLFNNITNITHFVHLLFHICACLYGEIIMQPFFLFDAGLLVGQESKKQVMNRQRPVHCPVFAFFFWKPNMNDTNQIISGLFRKGAIYGTMVNLE